MGRVKETLLEEIETVARLSNETTEAVQQEWENAERRGMSFSSFVVGKSRKKMNR